MSSFPNNIDDETVDKVVSLFAERFENDILNTGASVTQDWVNSVLNHIVETTGYERVTVGIIALNFVMRLAEAEEITDEHE